MKDKKQDQGANVQKIYTLLTDYFTKGKIFICTITVFEQKAI